MESPPGAVIPAIDTASSTAAIRSLGRHGINPIVVSEHDDPPGQQSRYCKRAVSVPDPTADIPGYEQALVSLARRAEVETILPFREVDIYALARRKSTLSELIGTPFPSLETLRSVQDRVELRDAAEAAGVSMPQTAPVSAWDRWEERCIVKPRYTVHAPEYAERFDEPRPESGSTEYIPAGTEPDPTALIEEMGHEPIVQEYVPSTTEYGFFALYDNGRPVATFQHRQERGWKYAGGPSAYRESVSIPALDQAGRALLDELDWHGVAMVEFLYDPVEEDFTLMEINPRFWSSLPFTVQAGVDFPRLYWERATETDPTHESVNSLQIATDGAGDGTDYEVGIGGHLLRGELLHLHSILREEYPLVERPSFGRRLGEICLSLAEERRFDYLSRDDPRPFVQEMRNTASELLPSFGE